MARYDANTEAGRAVRSVKLDGRELMDVEYVRSCDTDEGWVDIYESEVVNGVRICKMAPGQFEHERNLSVKRLTGKVEVTSEE